MSSAMRADERYNDRVVRQFTVMTVVWGIVGMLVGVLIAAQLYCPGSPSAGCARTIPSA